MMKNYQLSLLLFSVTFLFSCKKDNNKIDFTILQLNDVYEIAPIQGGEFGGMARVATVHQNLLQENKNTLMVLAGDFLSPSLLGTLRVDNDRVNGKQMVEVMNAMNFDVVAFGNHEFDLSQKELQKRLNESSFPWISSNVKLVSEKDTLSFYKEINGAKIPLKETFIKEFSDEDGTKIKIGFISVCIPSNPKEYVFYENMFDKIRDSYNQIKDSVDVVFGLTHVKIANDKRIAKLLPNIPLIMGGHEHTNKREMVGNTLITKADANAKTVYVHRISFDKKTKKATIVSELKEINQSVKEDKEVGEIVSKWQTILTDNIIKVIENPNEIIFNANPGLDGRDTQVRSEQTNLGILITKSMSYSFDNQVDCALVNGGSIRIDDVLQGDVTTIDFFRVLPFGGGILKVQIEGRLLKRVLDYGELAAGTGAYLQRFNVEKVNDIWMIDDKKIDLQKKYSVAFSDYLLKGFDIPFLSEENKEVIAVYKPTAEELAFDIRKAVVAYLKNQ